MNALSPSRSVAPLLLAIELRLARVAARRSAVPLPSVAAQAHEEALMAMAAEQLQQLDFAVVATARTTSHFRPADGRNVDRHRGAWHKSKQRLVASAQPEGSGVQTRALVALRPVRVSTAAQPTGEFLARLTTEPTALMNRRGECAEVRAAQEAARPVPRRATRPRPLDRPRPSNRPGSWRPSTALTPRHLEAISK
jgi:hypothetical protein